MKRLTATLLLALAPLTIHADDAGLASRDSPFPVAETLDRLESVLQTKGIKVFARVDHTGEAQGAGLKLRPTQLLIFGNPKAGTPLMDAAPSIAIDLPMKVLAYQDDQGRVRVLWNDPDYLGRRHGLEAASTKTLGAVAGLVEAALK